MKVLIPIVVVFIMAWTYSGIVSACGGKDASCSIGLGTLFASCCNPYSCTPNSAGSTTGKCDCNQEKRRCNNGKCCPGLDCENGVCISAGSPDGSECSKYENCHSKNCVMHETAPPNEYQEGCNLDDCREGNKYCTDRGYCRDNVKSICECRENGVSAATSSCPNFNLGDTVPTTAEIDKLLKLCSYRVGSCCSGRTNLENDCVCYKTVGQTCTKKQECCSGTCQNGVCV